MTRPPIDLTDSSEEIDVDVPADTGPSAPPSLAPVTASEPMAEPVDREALKRKLRRKRADTDPSPETLAAFDVWREGNRTDRVTATEARRVTEVAKLNTNTQ